MWIILQTQYTDTHINKDVKNAQEINMQNTNVNFTYSIKALHKFPVKFMYSAFYIKWIYYTCKCIICET